MLIVFIHVIGIKAGEVLQRLKSVEASLDADLSTVPITYAGLLIDATVGGEFALVGLFHHHFVERHAREIIKTLFTHSVSGRPNSCPSFTKF